MYDLGVRRIARYIFQALSFLSLVLCLTWLALWSRSYWIGDEIWISWLDRPVRGLDTWGTEQHAGWRLQLTCANGSVGLDWEPKTQPPNLFSGTAGYQLRHSTIRPEEGDSGLAEHIYPGSGFGLREGFWKDTAKQSGSWTWRWRRFMVIHGRAPYAAQVFVSVPHWALVMLFGFLPAAHRLTRWRRARRVRRLQGCCSTCGYDLRATPDQCPECGAVPGSNEGVVATS